jgi:hypothetical protein
MVMKKSLSMLNSTSNIESSNVPKLDFKTYRKHVPRSVCDTERDRRQHRDPLKEEEMQ